MSNLNYAYSAWIGSKIQERLDAGFTQGNSSTDGTLIIGNKGDLVGDIDPVIPTDTPLPSYVTAEEAVGWPNNMTCAVACLIIGKLASSKGASDGYTFIGSLPE